MTRYFLKRLAGAIPTLFVIITAAFFLIRAVPGGPFDQEQSLPPEILANLQRAYGLDLPVWQQYGRYVSALAHGDFGPSFKYKDFSVTELIAQGFPVTLEIGVAALLLAVLVGIPAGVFAALHRNSAADYATMSLAVVGIAVPSFVVLPFLGLLFGIRLHWLPVAGWEPGLHPSFDPARARAQPAAARVHGPDDARKHARSAAQRFHPYGVRQGLPLRVVILRHALRPALIPVAGYLAPAVAAILTGSLVVESIAGLPGIGRYLVQGALNRDYTLVMGMVVIYSALLIAMGLVVDLMYAWLDPRIRYAG